MNKKLPICIECKEEYDRPSGIMLNVCTPCMKKLKNRPESYIKSGNLLIPNSELQAKT